MQLTGCTVEATFLAIRVTCDHPKCDCSRLKLCQHRHTALNQRAEPCYAQGAHWGRSEGPRAQTRASAGPPAPAAAAGFPNRLPAVAAGAARRPARARQPCRVLRTAGWSRHPQALPARAYGTYCQ